MLKRISIIITILLISIQAASAAEVGIGVSPGNLSFELNPGAQEEKSMHVTNTGSEAANYEIYIENATYKDWFSISPSSISLQSGENKEIKVRLTVPSSAEIDVDCKILVQPTSGTDVMAGARVLTHIDLPGSGSDDSSGSSSGDSSGGSSGDSSGGSSGSSSGSSSGGGGGSPEPAENVKVKEISQQFVTKGNHIKFDFPQKATQVTFVEFDAKKTAGKITTIVEELKGNSTLTPTEPEGTIYQHLNIWVGNGGFATQENIENSIVRFRVNKSWVKENDIDVNSITFQHFVNNTWNSLPTAKLDEKDEYFDFEAKTPGFSPFAITGQKIGSSTEIKNMSGTESNLQDTQKQTPAESGNKEKNNSTATPGFCSILAAAGIAVSAVMVKRKWFR